MLLHVAVSRVTAQLHDCGSDELTPGTTAGRAHKGTYPQVLVIYCVNPSLSFCKPSASVFLNQPVSFSLILTCLVNIFLAFVSEPILNKMVDSPAIIKSLNVLES